jgi:hypothetical protein
MLEEEKAAAVSRHLAECAQCRAELDFLAQIRTALGSLEKIPAPEYLKDLVKVGIANSERLSWWGGIRSDLQYYWSRMRTVEGTWFFTRILGTTVAFAFFFLVFTSAMSPVDFGPDSNKQDRGGLSQASQLAANVLKNLGLMPLEEQKKPVNSKEAELNKQYLVDVVENSSVSTQDDSFCVVAFVDRSGLGRIDWILEYPSDRKLLDDFSSMIATARFRPASLNGRPVESHLGFHFSKIYVHD